MYRPEYDTNYMKHEYLGEGASLEAWSEDIHKFKSIIQVKTESRAICNKSIDIVVDDQVTYYN